MKRFDVTVWDREGFIQDRLLENATNLRAVNELNGERIFSFSIAINDPKYTFLEFKKIIRLVDNTIDTFSTTIIQAPATGKNISVLSGANFELGDFLLVYEKPAYTISRRLTAAITPAIPMTLTLDSYANINVGDYLRIEDENGSEIFKVLTTPGTSITANIAHSYTAGASVTSPARSLIGKITSARKASTTTLNAEAASGSAVVIEVNSTLGIMVGDYVWIDDGISEEAAYVQAVLAGISITVSSLSNSYNAGAVVTDYSFTLSRRDFRPLANAEVRKVNFTTYRISTFSEERTGGMPIATINCNHISYDLNDQYFLIDGRGDISYSVKGTGIINSDRIDIDSLLDDMLVRQVNASGDPIDIGKFFKGNLFSFRYSIGTVSVTNGTDFISGSSTLWRENNISSGSILSIEGDSTFYTVAYVSNETLITLTATIGRETASGLKYLIISSGFQTSITDKTGTCSVRQDPTDYTEVSSISVAVNDGTVKAGAIFNVEGDTKDYYVRKVEFSNVMHLTEEVERAAGTLLDFIIKRDEREITFSSATTLLGCLNEIANIWSDDRQDIWFEIDEDKSINIRRKPSPDNRDPTSDLEIRYSYNLVKNLQAVKRLYDETEFGNRVLALGARSGWMNAFSNITSLVISDSSNSLLSLKVTAGDTQKFRPGDFIHVFQDKVDISNITSASQVTLSKSGATWNTNQFHGGLVLITSGVGVGQLRSVVSNTATQIVISRAWDTLPISANAIVAKSIGDSKIRGFGYIKFLVSAAGNTYVDISGTTLTAYAYRGGILSITSGTGIGQRWEIADNTISRVYINGTFNPNPDTTSYVEIEAPAQMVEEYRSGTAFTASTVVVVPGNHSLPAWRDDMWNAGKLYITSGADSGNSYTISDTAWNAGTGEGTITIIGTFSTTPAAGDGILIIKETDLALSCAKLPFKPDVGDSVVLLLYETGGALTVGKYADYRSTVVSATQSTITVQTGDGTKFAAYQIIFVGTKTITSSLNFGICRGNQAIGQVVTIDSVSGDTLTIIEPLNPTPQPCDHVEIMALVDVSSIVARGLIELPYDASDINDPKILHTLAGKFLEEAVEFSPRYEIEFVHLYELDPNTWKFDNYELGDTIRVIDDEIGIDLSTLRIIHEEFDPNLPASVKIQVATSAKLAKSLARLQAEIISAKIDVIEPTIDIHKRILDVPKCVYWNEEMKKCSRTILPNIFCNTSESNRDGRLTARKQRITIIDCGAYAEPMKTLEQYFRDFWSATQNTVTITGASTTIAITPTVAIPSGDYGIPVGAVIDCVHLLMRWRQTEDTSGSDNAINNASMALQIDDSSNTGWLTAYSFTNGAFRVDVDLITFTDFTEAVITFYLDESSGYEVESITNINSRVDEADTYDCQIINAQATGSNLILRDFQWGLRVFWH